MMNFRQLLLATFSLLCPSLVLGARRKHVAPIKPYEGPVPWDEIPTPISVLANRTKFGELYRWPKINHVAAYIVVQPADGGPPTTVLQNPGQIQALGGYQMAQSLPYKVHALRSEMYDEGNVVVTDENLIRTSPLYIKSCCVGGQKGPVLLQVFYLREGDWISKMGSWEFGRRGVGPNDEGGWANPIVKNLPLEKDGEGIENYLGRKWRPVDRAAFMWLKNSGVIDKIQNEEDAATLWENGVLQTFDDDLKQEEWFLGLQQSLEKSWIKEALEFVVKAAWKPVSKAMQLRILCC
jgi:hypothetical protein